MNEIIAKFDKICIPCPLNFTDELERKLQFKRNQKFLIMQITIFVLLSIYVLVIKEKPNLANYWFMLVFFSNILVFCLLCRSYPSVYRMFYATVLTLASPVALHLDKEGIIGCWSFAYLAPMLGLYYSGCRSMYVSQVSIQLIYMNVYYQDKMLEVLEEKTSQIFIRELMSCTTFAIVLSSVIVYNIGVSLVDTFKQEILFGEKQRKELEVQKTFVLSFSHEIRNLINTLIGNVQLSLLETIPPKVKCYLEDAESGASLLLHLINNILDTGNLAVGELDINESNQSIHTTLERMWRMCAYLLKAKGLRGKFRIFKNLPRNLKLDHERFMQILINLIVNAVKFTDQGSVDIELGWIPNATRATKDSFYPTPFDDENEGIFEKSQAFSVFGDDFTVVTLDKKKWSSDRYNNSNGTGPGLLKISVTDTGYGVTPENLPHVFNGFSHQVFGNGKSKKLGTTIGLYVTKELCHKMGGDIKIFSKVDKGTSFIVCIPAKQTPPEHHLHRTCSVFSDLCQERKLKAMIVDDLHFNTVVLSNYLERMKIDVANTAVDGVDAYTKYVESAKLGNQFDIVTMDVEMPIMNGKEAARKIREYERANNLSPCFLIMVSGNVTESEISQCLKHKGQVLANYFLKKPAIFDDVSRVINEYFSINSKSSMSHFY